MPVNDPNVVKQLEAPMRWIGMYAAIASTICTLAMAADVFHGFRSRKYWFPSKYFSLNAMSLTLLAVAMKLPVDLTTKMYSATDRLAKVSSLAFMSIAMANFLTSLGSMDDKSLLMNVVALAILVITITGNVCIQIFQMRSYLHSRRAFCEESLAMGCMLVLLIMFISSVLAILSTKQYLEKRCRHIFDEEQLVDMRSANTNERRESIKKYWVMAETSSPQFVIARSVTSTVSGIVSVIVAVILVEAEIRIAIKEGIFSQTYSSYKESTRGVLLSQTIGVIVGAIAPTSRWFIAIYHRTSTGCINNIKNALKVEDYWTQKLVEWRRSSLSVGIQHLEIRKALQHLRGRILTLGIFVQHLIVRVSKIVLAVSICMARPIKYCLHYIRRLRQVGISDSVSPEVGIRRYIIQLEGEVELPAETLRNIDQEVDEIIERGRMRKPINLYDLLSRSSNFQGVKQFDSNQVPNLLTQELPYCWSLPVVTLVCIALAIPNVPRNISKRLLSGVTEGLRYVKLIDKLLDRKCQLARAAADAVRVEAELLGMWQNNDLNEISVHGTNADEVLRQLQQDSETTVRNSNYWPSEVIAANSMYRASKTILLNRGGGERDTTDEQLFERISLMIADILAACLTNLPRAINIKCHRTAIEEREGGVRKAAKYLGETEAIIALLQERELPNLTPDKAVQIEEWRALSYDQLGIQQQSGEAHA